MYKAIFLPDFNYDNDIPVFIYNKERDQFIHKYISKIGEEAELFYSYKEVEKDKRWTVFQINEDEKVTQLTKSGLKVLKAIDKLS